jgi:hypothetical protein
VAALINPLTAAPILTAPANGKPISYRASGTHLVAIPGEITDFCAQAAVIFPDIS